MHAEEFWELRDKGIQCQLCPHNCYLKLGGAGICRTRSNIKNSLVNHNYGKVSCLALDPIEKKPLFHVKPGSKIISVGFAGCNFKCDFCQNWNISQNIPVLRELSPEELIKQAKLGSSVGIAYTYNEPLTNFEYILDTAHLAKEQGLINVVVSNGFINPKPLKKLLPVIDAWNIDIKAMQPEFYSTICKAKLEAVLETVEVLSKSSYIEITNLIIPTLNDKEQDIDELVAWIARLSADIPLHFTRYFPQYKSAIPMTDIKKLYQAYNIAKKVLNWVYLGNIADNSNTFCPKCNSLLISRPAYNNIEVINLVHNKCKRCGNLVPGIL